MDLYTVDVYNFWVGLVLSVAEMFSPFIRRSKEDTLDRSKLDVDSFDLREPFCVPTRIEKGEPRTSEPLKYTYTRYLPASSGTKDTRYCMRPKSSIL